jgi:hypothetical protein
LQKRMLDPPKVPDELKFVSPKTPDMATEQREKRKGERYRDHRMEDHCCKPPVGGTELCIPVSHSEKYALPEGSLT